METQTVSIYLYFMSHSQCKGDPYYIPYILQLQKHTFLLFLLTPSDQNWLPEFRMNLYLPPPPRLQEQESVVDTSGKNLSLQTLSLWSGAEWGSLSCLRSTCLGPKCLTEESKETGRMFDITNPRGFLTWNQPRSSFHTCMCQKWVSAA